MDGEARRYRAFISYSHRDEAVAAALHRRLERYRLPRRLQRGVAEGERRVPDRLAPIFRDMEELSAADSLSVAVEAALQRSEVLVVLCSPAAAASPWVAKEIQRFRELHPDRPVLAALIAGTPDEAFPAPLTAGGAEPLAADLSRPGSAAQLGFLKLVAGIAGVDLDSLVQRDAQRRLRRVMAVTGAAFILVLLMAAMLLYALAARDEADHRRQEAQVERAQAEGLVDFMLTDLRERLKPAGRLDVLEAANRRALAYFAGQDLSRLSPERLQRRAAGLHNLVEDEISAKHWQPALAAAREAHRTTAALLAAAPDDPDRVFGHAQSVFWLAHIPYVQDDFAGAAPGYAEYDRLTRRLLALAPGDTRSLEEAGFGAGNLCELGKWRHQRDGLMAQCRRALALMQQAAARKPDDLAAQLRVANRMAWAADAAASLDDLDGARQLREQEARLLAGLRLRHPDDARIVPAMAATDRALARICWQQGDGLGARRHLTRGLAMLTAAAAADPTNRGLADWARDMRNDMEVYR